jgi:hypothetical protein
MDAPAGDSNDFRRKFFAFDEEFGKYSSVLIVIIIS